MAENTGIQTEMWTGIGSPGFQTRLARLSRYYLADIIVAVDFDGTCVTHEFPGIGTDLPGAADVLDALSEAGAKLVLWTMRSDIGELAAPSPLTDRADAYLQHACGWFANRSILLWGINNNPQQGQWTASPKCYAHLYIDDAALGCPLVHDKHSRPYVDWDKVLDLLLDRFFDRDTTRRSEAFAEWMKDLGHEVAQLPEQYQSFFDLRPANDEAWRVDFQEGEVPIDVVMENVSALQG